ncbi:MAG: FAD:protein FMN transferase [Lachnospiraceae bacterium]|nr:FAD:protein FMN transferase [Lachnospiraceae bacterium]
MKKQRWIGLCLLICMMFVMTGCGRATEKYTNTDFAMGTTITELLYGDLDDCESSGKEIIDLLKEIEKEQISWRQTDSQIYKINHTNKNVSVDKDVSNWLSETLKLAKDSDGALNPGVGVLAQLWDIGGENPRVPKQKEIDDALKKIDYQQISLKQGNVVTDPDQVQVDLGAIGKGIGADQAMAYLKKQENITGGIISVGGSLCVYGKKPDGEKWAVGIQDPRGKDGEMFGAVRTDGDCYISTSGDYEKYIEQDGKRYHHILDSKTGYPSESGLISVTIMCNSGIDSDGLSTACFVIGMDKSQKLLKKYNAEAIFVDKDKNVYVTDGIDFELQNKKDYKIIK